MAILRRFNISWRVKGSTLMETLVATVLIVVIFVLASMILNNLFSNSIKNNTQAIENHLNELQYLQQNEQLVLPYIDTYKNWDVIVDTYIEENQNFIEFEAQNKTTNKTLRIVKRED